MIELGRIDIVTKVSMLSYNNAYSSERNFEAALHVMSYSKVSRNSRLALEPSYRKIGYKKFKDNDWADFYCDVKDPPTPLGKSVDLRIMVNRNHAGDKMARQSCTGFWILCNTALINCLSKKHPTMESAVFGAKFFSMKHGVETVYGLR